MFDVKLYDENGERETIRGLSWLQMTTVQSVIARLHFLLGNRQYKHKTEQVADESELAALRSQLEQVTAERESIESQLAKILVGVYIHQNDFTSEEASMTAALYWENWNDVKAAALKGGKG